MVAYSAHTTNSNIHLLTTQKTNKQEPHTRAYLSDNVGLGKMKSREWAKSRKGWDRKSDRIRQKNNRGYIEKWDQTESPEILDRGETSEIPGLPSGGDGDGGGDDDDDGDDDEWQFVERFMISKNHDKLSHAHGASQTGQTKNKE